MNKTIALALYEYKGKVNVKADLVSLLLVSILIFSRLFAGQVAEDTPPTKLVILFENPNGELYSQLATEMKKLNIPVYQDSNTVLEMLEIDNIDAYVDICNSCKKPTLKVFSKKEFTALNYINLIKSKIEPILIPSIFRINDKLYFDIMDGYSIELVNSNKDIYKQFITINTLFMVLTIIGVLSAFAYLLQGITDEKDTKVTLMYMSCMKVKEWIDSKVLASTCLSLKNFLMYIVLGGVGLTYFGIIELSINEWIEFIKTKLLYLTITFAIGYMFWCYLFSLISVLINNSNSPIKNAAVLLPMTAFGIVLSMLDFASSELFELLNFLPFTYLFTMSAGIVLTNFDYVIFSYSSLLTIFLTILLRHLAIKYVKFDG